MYKEKQVRRTKLYESAATIWLTGLSGSGKSTIAQALQHALGVLDRPLQVLDGDQLRTGLNRDLTFSKVDRQENIRRIAEVAKLFNEAGLFVVVAVISPYRTDREIARSLVGTDRFLEVYVNTPLATCEQRDPKGLYAQARSGALSEFTGISATYEKPASPHLSINTACSSVHGGVHSILELLVRRGFLEKSILRSDDVLKAVYA